MPDLPSRLIHSGNFSTVEAIIAGHCTGDGKTFAGGSPDQFVTDEDIKRIVFTRWPGVVSLSSSISSLKSLLMSDCFEYSPTKRETRD